MSVGTFYYLRCEGCADLYRDMTLERYEVRAQATARGWTRSDRPSWALCEPTPALIDLCPKCTKRAQNEP